VLTTARVHMIS